MTLNSFADLYFAFLLSGKAEDFQRVSTAFTEAVEAGVPIDLLQLSMDESHTTAETLCLMIDKAPVTKLG